MNKVKEASIVKTHKIHKIILSKTNMCKINKDIIPYKCFIYVCILYINI